MDEERTLKNVASKQRQVGRERVVRAMLEGRTFQQVNEELEMPLKRAMAYRLLRAVRTKGESALQDGRHGHPSKLRGEVRAFLEGASREDTCTPSSALQRALHERFDLQVSVSQINRVRATLGLSNHSRQSSQEKKREEQGLLRLCQNGKKAQGVSYYLLLLMKRNCFLAWRRLCPRI